MLRLFKYLKAKDYLALVAAIILIVFGVMLDLKLPDYMSDLTKLFYSPNYQLSDVALPGIKMLLCAVGSGIISAIVGFLSAVLSSNFAKYVRYALFSKVLSLSPSEIDKFSTASLITRTTNDVTQMQMTIAMGMQVMVRAPITAVLAIIKIIDKGTTGWVMATGISVGVLIIVLAIIVSLCLPRFRKVQRLTDAVNGVSRENLTGLRVIKTFNAEKYQLNKFEKVNTDLTKNNLFTSVATALLNPLMMLIMNGLSLAIYWIGAYTINNAVSLESQEQIFSNMIVFSSYAMQVVMAFLLLVAIFMIVPRAMVSGKRINQVLRTKIDIKEGSFNKQTEIKGELEFKHVSFSYNDEKDEDNEEVLQDIMEKPFLTDIGNGIVRFYNFKKVTPIITLDRIWISNDKDDVLRAYIAINGKDGLNCHNVENNHRQDSIYEIAVPSDIRIGGTKLDTGLFGLIKAVDSGFDLKYCDLCIHYNYCMLNIQIIDNQTGQKAIRPIYVSQIRDLDKNIQASSCNKYSKNIYYIRTKLNQLNKMPYWEWKKEND